MQAMLADFFGAHHLPLEVILLRLAMTIILVGAIGYERASKERPAGLRTHVLVGLASAMFAILTVEMVNSSLLDGSHVGADPLRLISAVTGGVAFLGAGAIIQGRGAIHGLTTGVALWMAGAIGAACGAGYGLIAVVATLLALVVLTLMRWMETGLGLKPSESQESDGKAG